MGMLSVVIVTYDSATCIGGCLASVRAALPEAEVVVVDNASRDDTASETRAVAPRARVIETGENVGFGRACNAGAEAAGGSHVLFLNPDVVVTAVDRERLHELLDTRPFGLLAPTFEGEGDQRQAENSWANEYVAYTFATLRPSEWRPRVWRFRGTKARWVSGAMLLVSRDEFLGLGGFDPRFFLYYEDRDLSHRYRDANLPIRTTGAIRGRHTRSSSSASDGLRAGPMAWSLLGWIQYMCIHEGEPKAVRAARATLITLRVLRLGMRALAALQWGRAQRKARQLDELLQLVAERAYGDDARFCPDALRVVRGLT
jgi:N-acetylglucosaminyl-diphospho-decaprenol L-rhamnosyltransferase